MRQLSIHGCVFLDGFLIFSSRGADQHVVPGLPAFNPGEKVEINLGMDDI
jgi:hypothetical protein